MRVFRWLPAPRGGRALIVAWFAAVALLLAMVLPAFAAKTPIRLVDASFTPQSANVGARVTFVVTYRNFDGVEASSVRAEFAGVRYALSPVKSKKTVQAGIRYQATVAPAAGSGTVRFVATDLQGQTATVSAGKLTIAAAPTSGSSGSSGSSSSGSGSSAGTGGSGSTSASGSGSSGAPDVAPAPTSGSIADAAPGGSSTMADDGSIARGGTYASTYPGITGSPTRDRSPAIPDESTSGAADPTRPMGLGRSALVGAGAAAGIAGLTGLGASTTPITAVLPVLVTTFGGATMLMAFMVFGKRRRDGEPTDSDAALSAAAATGYGVAATATIVDAEMAMPRWRRPSLLEARKADPLRHPTAPDVRLTFDHGLVDPLAGHERRRIRYRVVRLLDSPDELTALDIGVLDAGDEVQLLERSGVYWFVLCPDGQRGWVHKMVLGETIEDPDLPGPAARATEPRADAEGAFAARLAAVGAGPVRATDTGDVDDDVLQAYLAARSRA